MVAGILLSMPALLDAFPAWIVVVTVLLAGRGMGYSYAAVALAGLRDAAPAEQGSSSAALQLSDILAAALGAGIGGAIIVVGSRAGGDGVGIGLAVTFAVAAAAAWLGSVRLGPRRPARTAQPAAVD